MKILIIAALLLLANAGVSQELYHFKELPKPYKREYKKTYRNWKHAVHFKKYQQKITKELIITRFRQIQQCEIKHSNDIKNIYKDARPENAKFYDNLKDMMTASQWHTWEVNEVKRIEKKKKKLKVEVLSYYEFWKY